MNTSYREINRQYTVWLDTLGFSSGVVDDYKDRVRDFLQWLETHSITQISILTQQHVTTYFEYLQSRPNKRRKGHLLSISHLNHNFSAVDKLLEFLHGQGAKNVPVPTGYRLYVDKDERIRNIKPFTQAEIKTLYDCIEHIYPNMDFIRRQAKQEQLKLVFALYYGCGLRRSEGYRLTFDDIDFERRTVFVRQGKGYKDRIVPMSAGVYTILQDYIYNFRNKLKPGHKQLFTYTTGTLNDSLQDLQSVCEDESIQNKYLSLHVLRHSIATNLLQNGMDIENIRVFLGHSSLDSTQIYTHILHHLST